MFNSSQLITDTDSASNSESGIASGSQTRSTSSSSASSLMQQSLNESIGKKMTDEPDNGTIMVYDVMPSQHQLNRNETERSTILSKSKPNLMDRIYRKTNELFLTNSKMTEQQIYSIEPSSSASTANSVVSPNTTTSNNNLSPVTTTTLTSNRQGTSEASDSKQTEKDIIYEWFMNNLNQPGPANSSPGTLEIKSNLSKTSQLMSTSQNSLATSTPTTTGTNLNSIESKSDYRNEIYRNSHLVLKNYTNNNSGTGSESSTGQYYKQLKKIQDLTSNYGSSNTEDLSTYAARPIITNQEDLIINQNSKLDKNFLSRPPPPMPPTRLESYLYSTDEMNSVKSLVKKDDNGQISCV